MRLSLKKVGEIIRADQTRRYVVPSAPGKRHINDTKVTDMLYHCYELAEKGKKFLPLLNEIKARYEEIIDGLQLELSLDKEFEVIAEQVFKKGRKRLCGIQRRISEWDCYEQLSGHHVY